MFGNFFQNWKKKNAVPQNPVQPDHQLQEQKTLNEIIEILNQMDEEMDRIEMKTNNLDTQVRELMALKKQDQAKIKIAAMQGYQKQLENYQTKRNALTQIKIIIENVTMDVYINKLELIIEVGNKRTQADEQNKKIQSALINFYHSVQQQQPINELLKHLAEIGVDEESLADWFAMYEQESNAEVMKNNNQAFSSNIQAQFE